MTEIERIRNLAIAIRNVSTLPAVKNMAEEIIMQAEMLQPVKLDTKRLPCPCGRKNLKKELKYANFKHYWRYVCPNCGRESEWVESEGKLITAWNKKLRSEPSPIPEFVQEIINKKMKEFWEGK